MTFEQFKAEAERLGLRAHLSGATSCWMIFSGEEFLCEWSPRYEEIVCGRRPGTPADALREAARLMRGDVAGKLREWLDVQISNDIKSRHKSVGEDEDAVHFYEASSVTIARVIAKLDELEGVIR